MEYMTKITSHLFLIGGRASGKTSLARLLASQLGTDWVDTDDVLQERIGESIADFVDRQGWDSFRDQETATLAAVCMQPAMVIACGGGIVLREENRKLLKQGRVMYLRAEPEVLAARLAGDPNEAQRPSLTGKSIQDEVREVMTEREPLYIECADIVLDGSLMLQEVAEAAMNALNEIS